MEFLNKSQIQKVIHTIILVLCTQSFMAQSIEKFSIDSGGAIASVSGIEMLYTIGEVNVQEINAGDVIVSEGFINPDLLISLGIEEIPYAQTLTIFPNPTSGNLHIKTNKLISKIELYNILGENIFTLENTLHINLYNLQSGTYFLKIYAENLIVTKKIIKN